MKFSAITNQMKKATIGIIFFFLFSSITFGGIPPGYYDAATGLNGAQLKTALYNIIKGHTFVSYTGLWSAYYTTDDKPNSTVWDIYSDVPDGSANGNPPYVYYFGTNQCATTPGIEGICYNREHSFPRSWSNTNDGDTIYSDMFHVYPVDSYVNTRRSNYPYGKVGTATWTSQNGSKLGLCVTPGYTGVVFEPRDEYKGDLARTYFYLATRYQNKIASWETNSLYGDAILDGTSYPCFEPWFITMLLAWNTADPVSQKEIDRNNEIHTNFQHNRNPFIDHPEYANAIWAPGTGVLPEPSNHAANFSAHNISLKWVDATGTVLPEAYLIRMSTVGYGDIQTPVDGIPVPDGPNDKNVLYGIQEVIFTNLTPGTDYYFKVFPYYGIEGGINYKTDGVIPQFQQSTTP